jgi:hypothetical protein
MAILTKFYTTWTSDDSQLYKLEVIQSHTAIDAQNTITSGFLVEELPADFLLKDMKFSASLGDIPIGIATQTLNVTFNIGAVGSGAAYTALIPKLLRGTDSTCQPLDGSSAIVGLEADTGFKCFNTYILSRSDDGGTTYDPFFIGCQKFAADTDIEITKLSPIIKIGIEIYDIGRCIGEIIKPRVWFYYLRCKHDLVDYGSQCTNLQYEDKDYNFMDIAYNFGEQPSNYNYLVSYYLYNRFTVGLNYKMQTFQQLYTKMDTMYSEHMVALLCTSCTYAFYPTGNINFYTLSTPSTPGTLLDQFDDVGFVSEVTDPKFTDPEYPLIYGKCIGGMLKDKDGFGQYTNYHEVLNNIAENFLYKGTQRYSFSGGTYGVEVSLGHMIPSTNSQFTVKQSTVYDTVKFKLFNDTLNTCKTVVSNIQGERDTTEWTYSEQATSGDNSKDVKLMFHNLPILTNGNVIDNADFVANPPDRIRFESNKYYVRNTINSGSLCYLSEDGIVRKVDTKCEIAYRASGNLSKSLAIDRLQSFVQQVITEQQNNGLALNIAYALVYTMGQTRFKTLEFRTTSKPNDSDVFRGIIPEYFGRYATIAYGDLNSILATWDPASPAISTLATIVDYSLDIYSGMVDVKLIAHGVTVS